MVGAHVRDIIGQERKQEAREGLGSLFYNLLLRE